MLEVDPGFWMCTGDGRLRASTWSLAGTKLAALVSSHWETATNKCGRSKFRSGIEFTPVVTGAGDPCVPRVWFCLVVLAALCSYP